MYVFRHKSYCGIFNEFILITRCYECFLSTGNLQSFSFFLFAQLRTSTQWARVLRYEKLNSYPARGSRIQPTENFSKTTGQYRSIPLNFEKKAAGRFLETHVCAHQRNKVSIKLLTKE